MREPIHATQSLNLSAGGRSLLLLVVFSPGATDNFGNILQCHIREVPNFQPAAGGLKMTAMELRPQQCL